MKRLCLVMLLVGAPVAPSIDAGPLPLDQLWRPNAALAQARNVSTKEAFEAAKELGTIEAWEAFLASFPDGFYADLARAYVKSLNDRGAASAPAPARDSAPRREAGASANRGSGVPPTDPGKPAVARGGQYMGFAERFNRYYTDPAWKPVEDRVCEPERQRQRRDPRHAHVGAGGGRGRAPRHPDPFPARQLPGLLRVLEDRTAARTTTRSFSTPSATRTSRSASAMTCCSSGRQTCFNFENADYIAVDGFELIGGRYGVRAVGAGYAASQHSRGIAVLNSNGHDQNRDPFFSGQSDWAVWERNVAYGAKAGDGHGIYLSNGSDWNIVRFNETYSQRLERLPDQRRPGVHLQGGRHSRSTTRAATPMPAPAKAARARATTSWSTRTTSTTAPARLGRELHERAPERHPQQHLRPLSPPRRELLAGDRQPEARLERQQDRPQPVRHDRRARPCSSSTTRPATSSRTT